MISSATTSSYSITIPLNSLGVFNCQHKLLAKNKILRKELGQVYNNFHKIYKKMFLKI